MIHLSQEDQTRLKNSAKVAQAIENKWDRTIASAIKTSATKAAEQITAGAEIDVPNFEKLFIEHYFDTWFKALKLAESENELEKRLAAKPRSIKEVLKLYDAWRKGLYKPKKIQKRAAGIRKEYISAIQETWKKHSEEFRHGEAQTQKEIRDKIVKSTGVSTARAQTIVRTETTRYYNEARRVYYDAAQDVTHYLFLAVRDKATTIWCKNGFTNGKRGRSGLVYAKDDKLLKTESPPCHWNCRSELLPLNRFNPTHQKLIKDASIQRRNNTCSPLPPGWNK